MGTKSNKVAVTKSDGDKNPLAIDYCRFDEKDIPDHLQRHCINGLIRKLRAIDAISTILQADQIEEDYEDGALCLRPEQSSGLIDALIELSGDGAEQAEKLGERITSLAKGRRNADA